MNKSKSKPEESEKEPEEEEEEEVPIEKLDSWQLYVHVHGKVIAVSCGNATQRIKWLAHVGIGNYIVIVLLKIISEISWVCSSMGRG